MSEPITSLIKPEHREKFYRDYAYGKRLCAQMTPALAALPGFDDWVLLTMLTDHFDNFGATKPVDTDRMRQLCERWIRQADDLVASLLADVVQSDGSIILPGGHHA